MKKLGEGSVISEKARLGRNVTVWNLTYIGPDTTIGDDVKIGSLVHIDYGVDIGRETKIEGCAYIPPLSKIGQRVFIGPGVVLTNDPYPPSKRLTGVIIDDDAVIGARAVIRAGVRIGRGSVVAMGSVVTKDVPPGVVVMGNPARVRYSRKEFDIKMSKWESGDST